LAVVVEVVAGVVGVAEAILANSTARLSRCGESPGGAARARAAMAAPRCRARRVPRWSSSRSIAASCQKPGVGAMG